MATFPSLAAHIAHERKQRIKFIRNTVKPHLSTKLQRTAPSGESRSVKLWQERGKNGVAKVFVLEKAFLLQSFEGLTPNGVIVDSQGWETSILPFSRIPVEDLNLLANWVSRKFTIDAAVHRTAKKKGQ